MDDTIYETAIDRMDARPRMPGEPGDHVDELDVRPPADVDARPVKMRWYEDGHFDVEMDGVMMRCVGFTRDDDGKEVYEFEPKGEEE